MKRNEGKKGWGREKNRKGDWRIGVGEQKDEGGTGEEDRSDENRGGDKKEEMIGREEKKKSIVYNNI